mmetsp:Transcript_28893/g.93145  ORF Transcript_28893/g.93145 Transcript_28893/m.93145 type:complete len:179 (+) Transcript_28893:67-603(+)
MRVSLLLVSGIRQWVRELVIGEGLCPFAKEAALTVVDGTTASSAVSFVVAESRKLATRKQKATTLVALEDMPLAAFVDLWKACEDGVAGDCEILAFHPSRRDRKGPETSQYAMRAPYPVIQLLRRRDLDEARATRGQTPRQRRDAMVSLLKANEDTLDDIGLPALEAMYRRWRSKSGS